MVGIYDSDVQKSIEQLAINLKTVIKAPEWSIFAKTGSNKERSPESPDWYYVRAASVLRTVYIRGPIGVEKLRVKYGSKKRRGHSPAIFVRSGGKVLRSILQQLEKATLVSYKKDGVHKGRVITAKGKSIVDKSAVLLKK